MISSATLRKHYIFTSFVLSLAAGPARVSRIKENIVIIRQIEESDKIISPINELIEAQRSEALELINKEVGKNHKIKRLENILQSERSLRHINCLRRYQRMLRTH